MIKIIPLKNKELKHTEYKSIMLALIIRKDIESGSGFESFNLGDYTYILTDKKGKNIFGPAFAYSTECEKEFDYIAKNML